MRRRRAKYFSWFLLLCFANCIGLNGIRNVKLLTHLSHKWHPVKTEYLSLKKQDVLPPVFFLMDKKENTDKQLLHPGLFGQESDYLNKIVLYPFSLMCQFSMAASDPIYLRIHNLRI